MTFPIDIRRSRQRWLTVKLGAAVALAPILLVLAASSLSAAPADGDFDTQVRPVLAKYCIKCHGATKPKGDLRLDTFQGAVDVTRDRATWESVLENLQAQSMPPEKQPTPMVEERERVVRWIDAGLTKADATGQRDPGRVTMRRLNRVEYNNTIRDLVGVTFQPADDFPSDDVGYGFDNIGDVLSLPTILMEKYLAAADKIMQSAIVTEESKKAAVKYFTGGLLKGSAQTYTDENGTTFLATEGELSTSFHFPKDGDYVFRIRASAQQAGDEPAKMELRIAEHDPQKFTVTAVEGAPEIYQGRFTIKAGKLRVAVAFTNDFYDEKAPEGKKDRNLLVDSLEIQGPTNLDASELPATHKRYITRRPNKPAEFEACAREALYGFASRAFRRPATSDELDRLIKLVLLARDQGDSYERDIQLAMQAVLVSPHFLFRVETDPAGSKPAAHYLNDFELASRLSYFLWSSMPDDALFVQAKRGDLRKPDVLVGHVRRMLADAKSDALVQNFAGQWLQTRNLSVIAPDGDRFPGFDDALRSAMQRETELFFGAILREDRSLLEFLDSDFTFVNERLARHYGIHGVLGNEFRRVKLHDHRRGGVITQASMLAVTSNPTRTSPVKRGKWILENILGTPPPPPPPSVAELKDDEHAVLTGTLRQRMEQHRADPNCASCHARMDPLGFGLENFNAIGAWRTDEGKFPIDSSGTLPGGQSFNGPAELKAILSARQADFTRCLTEKLLTYALGRGLEYHDKYAVGQICLAVARENHRLSSLIREIATSEPFQMRRPPREARK
jgi:hypothetical protein